MWDVKPEVVRVAGKYREMFDAPQTRLSLAEAATAERTRVLGELRRRVEVDCQHYDWMLELDPKGALISAGDLAALIEDLEKS